MQLMDSELLFEVSGSSSGAGSENVVDGFRLRGIVEVVVLKSRPPVSPRSPRAASWASFTIVMAWGNVGEATTNDK